VHKRLVLAELNKLRVAKKPVLGSDVTRSELVTQCVQADDLRRRELLGKAKEKVSAPCVPSLSTTRPFPP
jgi:hypothetical protein